MDVVRPKATGRRRFNPTAAADRIAAAEERAATHWQQILAGDEALRVAEHRAEVAEARAALAEAGALSALRRVEEQGAELVRRAGQIDALLARVANLSSMSLPAPIDRYPEAHGETTVRMDVRTLREQFGSGRPAEHGAHARSAA